MKREVRIVLVSKSERRRENCQRHDSEPKSLPEEALKF